MKHPTHPQARRAFTLVELLVTVMVMGLLAVLLVPALTSVRQQGQNAACIANVRALLSSVLTYTGENDGYLPPPYQYDTNPANTPNSYMVDGYPWKAVFDTALTKENTASTKLFYCPANLDPEFGALKRRGTSSDWKRSSYYYYFPFSSASEDPEAKFRVSLAQVNESPCVLLSDNIKWKGLIPKFHGGKGINVGFSDGSVSHIRTDPAADFYADVMPGFPDGNVSLTVVDAVAKKFRETRFAR